MGSEMCIRDRFLNLISTALRILALRYQQTNKKPINRKVQQLDYFQFTNFLCISVKYRKDNLLAANNTTSVPVSTSDYRSDAGGIAILASATTRTPAARRLPGSLSHSSHEETPKELPVDITLQSGREIIHASSLPVRQTATLSVIPAEA